MSQRSKESRAASIQPDSKELGRRLIERLFNEHNEALLRFLRIRLQSDAEASEVAQEAYVRLLRLDEPGTVSYLRAFLFKIAANLAIDRMRGRERAAKHLTLTFFEETQPSEEDSELEREKIRLINTYINELPPKCRKAFLLSRFYGLSTADIAKQMSLSSRMIRKYLVRATEYCGICLEKDIGNQYE